MQKRGVLILVSGAGFFIMVMAILLATDLLMHHKFDQFAALNYRGYRGKVLGSKNANEKRVLLLGGSTVFGYGVKPDETISTKLETVLNQNSSSNTVSVVNLGFNNTGAKPFLNDLTTYEYLNYDLVVIYESYDDAFVNHFMGRHDSAIFRWFGYYPVLPVILTEKAKLIRMGGTFTKPTDSKVVFNPNLADRAKASSLEAVAKLHDSLNKIADGANEKDLSNSKTELIPECGVSWSHYCASIEKAVDYSIRHARPVIVASEPSNVEGLASQERALSSRLNAKYKNQKLLTYLNLIRALDVNDRSLTVDGLHLSAFGAEVIAKRLAPYIWEALGISPDLNVANSMLNDSAID